jgi:two-component system LytT family response regulator
MRVLIVDDERLARGELRRLLAAHPQVQVLGEAANIVQARERIEALRPDLLLLDIRMPGGSGFDLLAALEVAPAVIFTTAFDAYAIEAFRVNALDYLLKPITAPMLAQALRRHTRARGEGAPERLFIKDGERCWFAALDRIALFESDGNYSRVYFDDQHPLMLRTLNQLEVTLDPARFVRVSRRHIVNLDFVERVVVGDGGNLALALKDGRQIDMSRRRASAFRLLHRI